MQRYNQYKSSGDSFVKSIPYHWKIDKLKRNCYLKGRIGWQGLKHSEFSDDKNLPYLITGMNFKNGVIQWDEVYHISEERYNEAPEIQLKNGDILMTKDGTIGKLLFVENLPGKASLNSHLLVLRPLNNAYFPRYLYYQLLSEHFNNHIELYKSGTTFYGLSQEDTGNFKILLPPIEEQTIISKYLDFKVGQIEKLIEDKENLISILNEEHIAIINQAITRGLDTTVPIKHSGISWLGEIPETWHANKIRYLSKSVKTGNTPPSEIIEYYLPQEIDWFTPGDFKDLKLINSKRKISQKAIEDGRCKLFPKNSVLMIGIGATLGKIGIIDNPASSNQQINCIVFDESKILPEFGAYFLTNYSTVTVSMASASTLAILNQNQTKDLYITVPPILEQEAILKFISVESDRINSVRLKIDEEIELLKEYKTALISEVVTGKVDVRNEVITQSFTMA